MAEPGGLLFYLFFQIFRVWLFGSNPFGRDVFYFGNDFASRVDCEGNHIPTSLEDLFEDESLALIHHATSVPVKCINKKLYRFTYDMRFMNLILI